MSEPEVVHLEVEPGEAVRLDWYPCTGLRPPALFIPGLGSTRRGEKARGFAERFNAAGRAFAALDLRGHGDSDGSIRELTMTRMLCDVAAATRWVAARSGTRRVLLLGASMGAAVAAWHALRHAGSVSGLVLIAPSLEFPASLASALAPADLERWRIERLRHVRSEWIDLELGYELIEDAASYDPAMLVRQLASPVLLIHGMLDTTIAWDRSVEFLRRRIASNPTSRTDIYLVSDGDHRLTAHKDLVIEILSAWTDRRPCAKEEDVRA